MKRKKVRNKEPSLVACILRGAWHDANTVVSIVAWPARTLAHAAHRELSKHHKAPAWLKRCANRHVYAVAIGITLLGISVGLEGLYHHFMWSVGTKTLEACGACPIWETMALVLGSRR